MFILIEKNNGVFNGFHYRHKDDKEVSPNFTSFDKSCSNLGMGRFVISGFFTMSSEQELTKQGEEWEKDIFRVSGINMKLFVVPIVWLQENWGCWKKNFPAQTKEK